MFDTENSTWSEMEIVDCFKYLGVKIEIAPFRLYKSYNEHIISVAKNYMYNILALSKAGPDTSTVAHALWVNCALPAILYGCETNVILESTIESLESIQSQVGNFILQLPICSSSTAGLVDAGLKPVRQVIEERKVAYHCRILTMPSWWWVRIAYNEHVSMGHDSRYLRELYNIKMKRNVLNLDFKLAKEIMSLSFKSKVIMKCQENIKSMALMFPKVFLDKPKPWVNDGMFSKILCRFRASDVGLGNRAPLRNGMKIKVCVLCKGMGGTCSLNNETHLLVSCKALEKAREECGISSFIAYQTRVGVNKSS